MRRFSVMALCALIVALTVFPAQAQGQNLLQNAGFESETYHLVFTDPKDPFTTYNAPDFWWGGVVLSPHDADWMNIPANGFPHTAGIKHGGGRSFNMARGYATFTAYLYQQVYTAPNTDLQGGAWAYIENPATGLVRVGIDPTGGTDPFSSNVVWSDWNGSRYNWTLTQVNARATTGTATLFLFATQGFPSNPNGVYWDDAFLNGTPGAPPAAGQPPAQNTQVVTPTVRVNVRAGAGTNFPTIGKANPSESFAFVGDAGDWYQVNFNGQTGYIAKQFSSLSQGQATAPGAVPAAPPANALQMTLLYNVRLRGAPTTKSPTLVSIPFKTVVSAVGRTADAAWVQVSFNGQTGWVASRFGQFSDDIQKLPIVA